jgi:hypothetical protein
MTHFASSVCRLARRSPQGVMGFRRGLAADCAGPQGLILAVFGGVTPLARCAASRSALCLAKHRQNQTKWVILKEMCFKGKVL